MLPSVEQITREYREASVALRKKLNTPAKARAFLRKAGINLEPVAPKSSKSSRKSTDD